MTKDEMDQWIDHDAAIWREECGDDLLGGYATLQEPPRHPQGNMP